jgi:hypothetical protein
MDDKEFNVYFSDLTPECQARLLERFDTTPEERNWDMDISPLFILTSEVEQISEY